MAENVTAMENVFIKTIFFSIILQHVISMIAKVFPLACLEKRDLTKSEIPYAIKIWLNCINDSQISTRYVDTFGDFDKIYLKRKINFNPLYFKNKRRRNEWGKKFLEFVHLPRTICR